MAFWNSDAEPLRQFRWYITFGGTGNLSEAVYALKKCDKPKIKVGSIQHKYLNHYYNFPGRVEWTDIKITFAAVRVNDAGKRLYDILGAAGYQFPSGPAQGQRKTINKATMRDQIGASVAITQVDTTGDTAIDTWELVNPFFTDVDFGTLDYGSDEIVEINCTLKYDSATLNHP